MNHTWVAKEKSDTAFVGSSPRIAPPPANTSTEAPRCTKHVAASSWLFTTAVTMGDSSNEVRAFIKAANGPCCGCVHSKHHLSTSTRPLKAAKCQILPGSVRLCCPSSCADGPLYGSLSQPLIWLAGRRSRVAGRVGESYLSRAVVGTNYEAVRSDGTIPYPSTIPY